MQVFELFKLLDMGPELLGTKDNKAPLDPTLAALWRRLKVLETFSDKDRKAVLQYVDVIAEKNKAKQDARKQSA